MTSCVTTEPYWKNLGKKRLIEKAKYILNSKCCDEKSCDELIHDLGQSAFKCDDLFREHHNINEKGVVTDNDSLCTDIRRRQQQIQEQMRTMSGRRGGTNKKRKGRKSRKSRKGRKSRSRKQKNRL